MLSRLKIKRYEKNIFIADYYQYIGLCSKCAIKFLLRSLSFICVPSVPGLFNLLNCSKATLLFICPILMQAKD